MNRTQHDFLLEGFLNLNNLRILLFFCFLPTFLLTLAGNMLVILLVQWHTRLHTPMYFFVTNLSFLEIWYTMTTAPKLLALLLTKDNRISYEWCFAQLYMFHGLGMTECALLAVMAFDRCMAICNPLRYTTIMNERMCRALAVICWTFGFLASVIPTTLTQKVPLCGLYYIDHYFCDLAPLLALACTDTSFTSAMNSSVIGFATMFNLVFIIIMYINIIWAIMKLKSNTGRMRAFSTCSSHLIVVVMFYSAAFTVYATPKGSWPTSYDKLIAIVYTIVTPLLNPIIYTLRNNEVKIALKETIQSKLETLKLH
ncbi:olfactory receptor 6N2-like [Xenopus laevis]|uniref:Olfactory receptor n=2 Tax=Xenopus laevis TaxID=8355 RepID=A0A1L8FBT0_XENLA|nr:olfactory receptor 6N2-like [Xenopus laevis]OCT68998.1 hypothetical protein XELAEV_18040306mg [Xenopus laevis]